MGSPHALGVGFDGPLDLADDELRHAGAAALTEEPLAHRVGGDVDRPLALHQLHRLLREVRAMLDGIHAGADRVEDAVRSLGVGRGSAPGPPRLAHARGQLVERELGGEPVGGRLGSRSHRWPSL